MPREPPTPNLRIPAAHATRALLQPILARHPGATVVLVRAESASASALAQAVLACRQGGALAVEVALDPGRPLAAHPAAWLTPLTMGAEPRTDARPDRLRLQAIGLRESTWQALGDARGWQRLHALLVAAAAAGVPCTVAWPVTLATLADLDAHDLDAFTAPLTIELLPPPTVPLPPEVLARLAAPLPASRHRFVRSPLWPAWVATDNPAVWLEFGRQKHHALPLLALGAGLRTVWRAEVEPADVPAFLARVLQPQGHPALGPPAMGGLPSLFAAVDAAANHDAGAVWAGGDRAPGTTRQLVLVARTQAAAAAALAIEQALHTTAGAAAEPLHRQLGAMYGYPPCCVEAFLAVTRELAGAPPGLADFAVSLARAGNRSQRWDSRLNAATSRTYARLIPHLPCRFDCEPSLHLHAQLAAACDAVQPDHAARRRAARREAALVWSDGAMLALTGTMDRERRQVLQPQVQVPTVEPASLRTVREAVHGADAVQDRGNGVLVAVRAGVELALVRPEAAAWPGLPRLLVFDVDR